MATVTFRNLQAERARHGLDTIDLAKVLGISRQSMCHRIKGHVALSLCEAKKLVDYFNSLGSNVTVDGLFFDNVSVADLQSD